MKGYVRFTIYSNIPSLLLLTPIAIHNIATGGNWAALMAFYNFVLYIIPVTIILVYLIRSLIKGLNPLKTYTALYFVLSTVCMLLFIYAWATFTPFVAAVSYVISYIAVKLYRYFRPSSDVANFDDDKRL